MKLGARGEVCALDIFFERIIMNTKWIREEKVAHVPRVLDVVKGQLCYIIGTAYIEMPLKANVLEDIAKDVGFFCTCYTRLLTTHGP